MEPRFILTVVLIQIGAPDLKTIVQQWEIFLGAFVAAYAIGSIPFGMLVTRLAGHGDIRKIGSGNIGATNVLRTGSKPLAALTLLLEVAKGLVVVLLAKFIGGPELTWFAAIGVVVGHIFPVWLRFRGGRGVATTIGTILGLSWLTGLAAIVIWLVVALAFRYSSLAALVALTVAPVVGWFVAEPQVGQLAAIFAVLVWLRHIGNVRRLVKGEEPKIALKRA